MTSLSFREQVFLIMLEKENQPYAEWGPVFENTQRIVEDVCEAWGHDEQPHFFEHPGAMTLQNPDKVHSHAKCARCGKTIK